MTLSEPTSTTTAGPTDPAAVLEVDDLHVHFRTGSGVVRDVNGLSYTVHAGEHDQVHCGLGSRPGECADGALFTPAPNVLAQLDVGAGSTPTQADFDFSDGSAYAMAGGDLDGIGHFKARNNTGAIVFCIAVVMVPYEYEAATPVCTCSPILRRER